MNNYYVYFWKRKLDDYIFHIGFGHNNRMYCKKRNKYFNRFYNKYECYVEIYKDNLSIDKNGNKDVTTICDECSRVDKK